MNRLFPFVALTLCARRAAAQQHDEGRARFEIIAGANFAKLSGNTDSDYRPGIVAGLGFVAPVAPGWFFEPEVIYSMKGAKTTGIVNSASTTETFKINYIEFPMLFRYEFPVGGEVRPFLNVGATPAFKISCDAEHTAGGTSSSATCDAAIFDIKDFDGGLMVGAGIAFHEMRHTITVGARYDYGLVDITSDGESKNRVLSVVGTIDFPWGSRR